MRGMIPIGDDNSDLRRRPLVVWLLLASCTAAWFWQLADPSLTYIWAAVPWELSNGENLAGLSVVVGGEKMPIPHRPTPEPWMLWLTPFTAMFLHGGWLHLLGNMLYLAIFGDQIEDRLGHTRFLLFYLSCGLIACLAHVAQDTESVIPMIGASGAIAGVLGAYLRCCPWRRVTVLFIIFPIPLPAVLVLGLWFYMQWSGLRDTDTAIAYMAHIGGFIAGLLLVGWFRPRDAG